MRKTPTSYTKQSPPRISVAAVGRGSHGLMLSTKLSKENLITEVMRRIPLTKLMHTMDGFFSKWIRARDPICIFQYAPEVYPNARACNNPSSQNSHFWGRGNKVTRYDPENCDGICGGCHMEHEGSKQGLYSEIKRWQLGKAKYEALERRARTNGQLFNAILEVMLWLW